MTYLDFVNKLITATKKKEAEWTESFDNTDEIKDAFEYKKGLDKVVIFKRDVYNNCDDYVGEEYTLVVKHAGKEVCRIDSENIFEDEEGEALYQYSDSGQKHILPRLYRLAQRSAKDVESIFSRITEGFSEENEELPF